MNKTELIDAMAADAGITKAAAKKALESFLGSVEKTLKKRCVERCTTKRKNEVLGCCGGAASPGAGREGDIAF